MSEFFSVRQTVPDDTPTLLVDDDACRRKVYVSSVVGSARIAFTEASVPDGALLASLSPSGSPAVFVLPPDTQLWVHQVSGGPADVDLLVTDTE